MTTEISRENLYRMVWEKPVLQVAAELDISDVALGKICRRHEIPVPGRGYWARKATGQKPRRLILKRPTDPSLEKVRISGSVILKLAPEVQRIVKQALQREKRSENRIEVPALSGDEHPVVSLTRNRLLKAKPAQDGMVTCSGPKVASCKIFPDNITRVSSILNAFFKAAEECGFVAQSNGERLVLCVNGEKMPFSLLERTGGFVDNRRNPEQDHAFEGHLVFRIDESRYDGLRRTFADGKRQRLETLLNAILAGFEACAAASVARREERERWNREWEEKRKLQEERRRASALESKRLDALNEMLSCWHKTREIRSLVEAVKSEAGSGEELPQATRDWISWAITHADHIDPLQNMSVRLLQFEDFKPWEL